MTPILAYARGKGASVRLVDGRVVIRGADARLMTELRQKKDRVLLELHREEDPYLYLPYRDKVGFILGIRDRFAELGEPGSPAVQECETWLRLARANDGSDVRWFRAHQARMAGFVRSLLPGILPTWLEGVQLVDAVLEIFPGSSLRKASIMPVATLTYVDKPRIESGAQEALGL